MTAGRFTATLALEAVAVARGGRTLAAGLALTLPPGGALALVGPNGSGKTSLLRVLAGLAEPAAGTVRITGTGDEAAPRGAHVHLGGHQDGLKGQLSVRENLAFWARYLGGAGGLPPLEALDRLGVAHVVDLPAGVLSQGQKRRVALARLLVAPRPVWLLDEPTAALDAASTARFLGLVEDHRAAGGLVVAATHTPLALAGLRTLDLAAYPAHARSGEALPGAGGDEEAYWLEGAGR